MALFGKKDKNKTEEKKDVKKVSAKKTVAKKDAKKIEKEPVKAKAKTEKKFGTAYKILIKPLVTEKVAKETELGKYVFEVSVDANKVEVSKAIKEVYGMKAVKVNIVNMEGKRKRLGRSSGRRKDWKKAIVTLEKGKKINVYEGV
ncbi:50S ribosomal protein L23 [Candidatus Parcubacteria bacterium]|nr:50S ribosomal protein L23 [Candidatus Parcubacteria bacterium]